MIVRSCAIMESVIQEVRAQRIVPWKNHSANLPVAITLFGLSKLLLLTLGWHRNVLGIRWL